MPIFLVALAGLLRAVTFGLVLQSMIRLGLGFATFVGVLEFVQYGRTQIYEVYGQLPADVLTMLSIARIDTALSIIMSAIVFRVTYGFGPRVTLNKPGAAP